MIVLDQDAVEERPAVVESTARANRGLLQLPHPWSRLPRVEQPGLRPGERLRVAPGDRRDAAQAHQEIQRGPLAGEDGAQRPAHAQDALAGIGGVRFPGERLQLAPRIERAEHPRRRTRQDLLDESQVRLAGRMAARARPVLKNVGV